MILEQRRAGALDILNRYEVTIDGKAHSICLASRVIEGSKVRANVDGKELVVVFSRPSKAEPGLILRVENQTFHIDVGGIGDAAPPTIRVDCGLSLLSCVSYPSSPRRRSSFRALQSQSLPRMERLLLRFPAESCLCGFGKATLLESGSRFSCLRQ